MADQPVEQRVRLRRHARRIAHDIALDHALALGVADAGEIQQQPERDLIWERPVVARLRTGGGGPWIAHVDMPELSRVELRARESQDWWFLEDYGVLKKTNTLIM